MPSPGLASIAGMRGLRPEPGWCSRNLWQGSAHKHPPHSHSHLHSALCSPWHSPGYSLFTVRNMDLLMSVPTPLLAWQR